MNWYNLLKLASDDLYEEINKFGPGGEGFIGREPIGRRLKELGEVTKEDLSTDPIMTEFERRRQFVRQYGWSVPSRRAIEEIKGFVGNEQIIEVGSGGGLWARLLQDAGVPVKATDILDQSPDLKNFTEVEQLSHLDAIQAYGDYGVLMLVWPPYDDPMAAEVLKSFKGNKLIYVGESEGGCTADDEFCSILNSYWQHVGYVDIPQWEGIHDDLNFWVRK
tara:strand:- start:85 stop:744 length:660 start_codon:yes stop_codon:yes gene_type:complete